MVFLWKTLYLENKSKICTKRDLFICYVHFCLIRRGFVCTGLGDINTDSDTASSFLPEDWDVEEICKLRYKYGYMNYRIHLGTETDGNLSVYVFAAAYQKALSVFIKLSEIARTRGPLYRMIPHYRKIAKLLNEELLDKVLNLTGQTPHFGNEII